MEELAWLAVLLVFVGLPVALLVTLVVLLVSLRRAVADLRARVAVLEGGTVSARAPAAAPAASQERVSAPRQVAVAPELRRVDAPVERPPGPTPPIARPPDSPPPVPPAAPRPPRTSLEERFGTQASVWLGAAAMALAGVFLVKLSFEQGWIGPPVRVGLGLGFGVALLGGAEWLRRSSARVAQGLAAAGIAVLFVSLYAGIELYGLIAPLPGFGLLALATAAAVGLSLRHGVMVAVLGLVGGLLTPRLASGAGGEAPVLFAYLMLLELGVLAVSRHRRWWGVAAANLAGALLWALIWATGPAAAEGAPWVGLFLLGSAGAFLVAAAGDEARAWGSPAVARGLGWAAVVGALVVMALLLEATGFRPLEWGFLALLAAGSLVLARLRPGFQALAPLAAAVVGVLVLVWLVDLEPPGGPLFLAVCAGFGALFAGGAYGALWRSPQAVRWAVLAAVCALGFDLLAWAGAETVEREPPWGAIQLALALLAAAAALPLARRREDWPPAEGALAALAGAATAFLGLALPMELERQWLSAAWGLEVALLVFAGGRLRLEVLGRLAAALAVVVTVRLLLNPALPSYPVGDHPLLSWIHYGYGVPVASLAAAAALAWRQGRGRLADGLVWCTLALAVTWVGLGVRQLFHPGDPFGAAVDLAELGVRSSGWAGLALGLLAAARRWPLPALRGAGPLLLAAVALAALLFQGLAWNPAWEALPVGERPLLNALLAAYGLPALLLALPLRRGGALAGASGGRRVAAWCAGIGALVLLFLLVTLEVRQAFRGSDLASGTASSAEGWAYSAAWVALGVVLLVAGLAGGRRVLRIASLVVMLLAVAKVFLYDMGRLPDLYRVFSFLGLGASLLLLAWLYQRFVFRGGDGRAGGVDSVP